MVPAILSRRRRVVIAPVGSSRGLDHPMCSVENVPAVGPVSVATANQYNPGPVVVVIAAPRTDMPIRMDVHFSGGRRVDHVHFLYRMGLYNVHFRRWMPYNSDVAPGLAIVITKRHSVAGPTADRYNRQDLKLRKTYNHR